MEGSVDVERWVLGTGFYVRNLEGKAALRSSCNSVTKSCSLERQILRGPEEPCEAPMEPRLLQPQALSGFSLYKVGKFY